MKSIKLTLVTAFLLGTVTLFAQEYTFKVLANKGTNEVKSGTDTWQPIRTGATLKKDDELKVSDNSYMGLIHANGKPLELKQAGSYKVADLAAKIGAGTSVLSKYTDFVLSNNTAESKKNKLSATGAVSRGENSAIQVMLPENQHAGVFNTVATITWDTKVEGPYIVTINNMFGDVLTKIETPETSVKIDLSDKKFTGENAVLVEVSSKSDPNKKSVERLIKKLTPQEQARVQGEFELIKVEAADQNAISKLLLAGFYEKNNLLIDAVGAYEEVLKLAPDVPAYKELYDDFLIRHGMKRVN